MAGNQPKNRRNPADHLVGHRFKKGEPSPNPSGRPKGSVSLLTRIKRKLREKIAEGPHAGKRYADLAADAYVKACLQGEFKHLKELLDRDEGPVGQAVPGTTVHVNVTQLSDDDIVRILTRRRAGGRALPPPSGT